MSIPPLLLGVALLFWGWQTGHLIPAAALGAALELSRLVRRRWEFTEDEVNQLWNLSTVLFLGAAVFAFATHRGTEAVSGFFRAGSFGERSLAMNQGALAVQVFIQWLPYVFFPFMAAQAYSQRPEVDLSTFSLWLRRRKRLAASGGRPLGPPRRVQVAPFYLAVALASACAANARGRLFYPALCALVAWALWTKRSRRYPLPVWLGAILVAAGLGYLGTRGLERLQALVENLPTNWMARFARRRADAKESRTALGAVGRIKLSGRIVLRLETPTGQLPPPLLREASYNTFRSPTWLGSTRTFNLLAPETNDTSWVLRRGLAAAQSVTLAAYLKGGEGLLALPTDTARLDDLPATSLETNHLGAVRVKEGPGLAWFQAAYGSGLTFDGPPEADDLTVPPAETNALAHIAAQLQLSNQPPAEVISRLSQFFLKNFEYKLRLTADPRGTTNETAMARFLLRERAGHCEYFATATTLLLRQAGLAARYALGYSVQEPAGHNRFVVRQRHAHAWCLYYDPQARAWRNVDTTPASWVATEREQAGWWEPLTDAWSRGWFEFQKLRWGRSNLRSYLLAALALLLVGMALRFLLRKQWRRQSAKAGAGPGDATPRFGLDSEFYLIEAALTRRGLERRASETFSGWLHRIEPLISPATPNLRALLQLHNRYRFDPDGVLPADRAKLKTEAQAWLAETR